MKGVANPLLNPLTGNGPIDRRNGLNHLKVGRSSQVTAGYGRGVLSLHVFTLYYSTLAMYFCTKG